VSNPPIDKGSAYEATPEDLVLSANLHLRRAKIEQSKLRESMMAYGQELKALRDSKEWLQKYSSFEHCLIGLIQQQPGGLTRGNVLAAKAALQMADGIEFSDEELFDLMIQVHFPEEVADKILSDDGGFDD
jgi:hypothetical protein